MAKKSDLIASSLTPAVSASKPANKWAAKDGKFSKTAAFATAGNVVVLGTYALQSWLAGSSFNIAGISGVVPAFDMAAATAILSILNGSYLFGRKIDSSSAE